MATLSEFRAKYPGAYDDLSDADLADKLYGKFYTDMPREEFNAKVGFTPKGVAEDVARQGVGGVSKGIVGAVTAPYEGLRYLLDEGVSIPGIGRASPGIKLPAAEDMPLYRPFLKQPKAETDAGRYAGAVGEAIGSTAVPAAGVMQKAKQLETVAPAVPGLADRFLRPIAQAPGAATAIDAASATGSGLAKQAAEDAGGGPGAQTAAALAGGIVTPVAVIGGAKALRSVAEKIIDKLPKMYLSADGAEPISAARERAIQMIADQATKAGITPDELARRVEGIDWARTFHTSGKAPDAMTLADLDEGFARLLGSAVRQQQEAANTARPFLKARQTGVTPEEPLHRGAGLPTRDAYARKITGADAQKLYGTDFGAGDKNLVAMGNHERLVEGLKRVFRINDTDYHGHAANANRTDEAIIEAAKIESRPAYAAVEKAGEKIDIRPVLQPVVDKWIKESSAKPPGIRDPIRALLKQFTKEDGSLVTNIKEFNEAKQFADGEIERWFKSIEGRNHHVGGVLNELKNDMLFAVDAIKKNQLGPLYKKARGVFAGHAESRRALQMGRDAYSEESDVGVDAFRALTDKSNQKLFRLGYLGAVEKKSANLPAGSDRSKLFSSPRVRETLANIIERSETKLGRVRMKGGRPAAFADRPQRFGGYVADEERMIRTRDIVSGNSKTAEREADDIAFDTLHTILDVFRNPSLVSIGKRSLELAINKAFGMRADASAELAKMLLTAEPTARAQIMRAVRDRMGSSRFQRFSQIMQQYENRSITGAVGGSATVSSEE
jgi:hypothetical protein